MVAELARSYRNQPKDGLTHFMSLYPKEEEAPAGQAGNTFNFNGLPQEYLVAIKSAGQPAPVTIEHDDAGTTRVQHDASDW